MTITAGQGDVLNLRDLEQELEQLNSLQSAQATIDIQPGPRMDDLSLQAYTKSIKTWF